MNTRTWTKRFGRLTGLVFAVSLGWFGTAQAGVTVSSPYFAFGGNWPANQPVAN